MKAESNVSTHTQPLLNDEQQAAIIGQGITDYIERKHHEKRVERALHFVFVFLVVMACGTGVAIVATAADHALHDHHQVVK